MPPGIPEHLSGEQLPVPNPVRSETLTDVRAAQDTIATTGCSPEEYNNCTEDLEIGREECRAECITSRVDLLADIGGVDTETINTGLLNTISKSNSEILAGGREALNEQLDWYASQYWKLSMVQAISDTDYDDIIQKLDGVRNSSKDMLGCLFQLAPVIYNANSAMSGIARAAISLWYGGDFEETHKYGTCDLVLTTINNSDNNFAVGYSESDGGYYTVDTNHIDTSNDMEVGTYLCSLNKSGKLTKENLLQPNGPFSPTELFTILDKFKSGDFGGPEVQGLFIGYLNGFEDNMNAIAEDYLANEQNGAHILAFLNAQTAAGNNTPLVDEDNIGDIFTITEDTDISTLQNEELRQVLLQERRMKAAGTLIKEILSIYEGGPNIEAELTEIIEGSARGEHSMFGFTRVNRIISEYNANVGDNEKQFTLIEGDLKDTIDRTISSFDEAHMAAQSYMLALTELENIKTLGEEKAEELQELQANLLRAVNQVPIDQNKVEKLQAQLQALRFASFYTEFQASQIEAAAETARLETESSTDDVENVVSEFDRYSTLFRRERINEVVRSKESFDLLISSVRSASDIQYLYENHSQYFPNIHLYMLHKDVRSNLDVIKGFPNLLRKEDLHSIGSSFYKENENIRYLIEESVEYSQGMASKIQFILLRNYEINNEDVAVSISQIQWVLQYSNLTIQQKEHIRNNIPTVLIRADEENALQITDRPERISTISLEEFNILSVKLENSQSLTLPERRDFDAYIGKYGLHQYKNSIINFISQGYFDGASEIQRLANSDFISKLGDRHESSEYYQAALSNNLANIVYLNQRCRNDYLSLQIIIEKSNNEEELIRYLQYTEIEDAGDFILVFNGLTRKLGSEAAARGMIGSMPRFYSSIQSLYESESTDEEDKETMGKILEIYALIKEGYILGSENMEQALNEGYHERLVIRGGENILSEMLGRNVSEYEKDVIKNILTVDEPSSLDLRNIISIFGESDEGEAQAKEFLERIASMRLDEIFAEIDRLLLEIQPTESNTEQFKSYFLNGTLDRGLFIDSVNRYISDTTLEKSDNESQQEYELRVKNVFISKLGLSSEQAQNISRILELESNAVNWSILTSNSETAARGEQVDYQSERNKRRTSGTLYLTSGEREGSEHFNYETGELEPNPEYQPPETPKRENDPKTIPPANLNPSELGLDARDTYREISSELMLTPEEQSSLTIEELDAISSNETVKENFIGFRSVLSELGITEMWKHRHSIFKAIGSLDINQNNGDYLSTEEMNKVVSKMVYATTGNARLQEVPPDLTSTKNIIKDINDQQGGINDINSVNSVGDALTGVELDFVEQFAPRNAGIVGFKFSAFQEALSRSPEK